MDEKSTKRVYLKKKIKPGQKEITLDCSACTLTSFMIGQVKPKDFTMQFLKERRILTC